MSDKEEILAAVAAGNAALSTRIDGVRDGLRGDIAALNTKLSGLSASVDVIATGVGRIEADVAAVKADVAQLRIDLAAYRMQSGTRITALEAKP